MSPFFMTDHHIFFWDDLHAYGSLRAVYQLLVPGELGVPPFHIYNVITSLFMMIWISVERQLFETPVFHDLILRFI